MKQSSYKGKSPLPDFVIDAACAGNVEAVERVLQHYDGYINKLCTRTLYDGSGQPHICIDEYMKRRLQIEEASKYFRIGENKLRRLAEENPTAGWVILNGNRIQIKRKQFEKIIDSIDTI